METTNITASSIEITLPFLVVGCIFILVSPIARKNLAGNF
jgi:hypothetical protein